MSPHLDAPPPTPRVTRPSRKASKPKTWRWWLGALIIVLVVAPLLWVVINGAINLAKAVSASYGPASTAGDFLSNVQSANYDQAYKDLYATITVQLSNSDFKQAALADDKCYGQVMSYEEVNGSATISSDQNTQSFTYTITRSKMTKTYQLTLVLQKDATGTWFITSYGTDLGPATPTCS
jgi:4-amino-4-deoxy-L-arabinose transferase-like glycosyltransferase